MSNRELLPRKGSDDPVASQPVRLFMKVPEAQVMPKPPSCMARAMGLHLYSDALLARKVRIEMNFAAGLLLLVSLFEWLLWMLLFNGLYNSSLSAVNYKTVLAALTATFFGVAVFWFERQMLTSNERGLRLFLAMAFRAAYILVSAYITSQTFELIIFKVPIQERIHEEGIREAAAQHYREVSEAEDLVRKLESGDPRQVAGIIQMTSDVEQAQLKDVQNQIKAAEGRRRRQLEQIGVARVDGDWSRVASLNGSIKATDDLLTKLGDRETGAGEDLIKRRNAIEAERQKLLNEAREKRPRLHDWIASVLNPKAKKGNAVEIWPYQDPGRSFFEKLLILEDLRVGRSVSWPGATPEVRQGLQQEFGFYEPPSCADLKAQRTLLSNLDISTMARLQGDIADCERRQAKTKIFNQAWWAGLFIALLIPTLILAIKALLMPKALRRYYSGLYPEPEG